MTLHFSYFSCHIPGNLLPIAWSKYEFYYFSVTMQVILCIFCIINSCLTLARAFLFAFGGLRAAIKVHDTLLNKLINAPVQFFDQTPSGRILNRLYFDAFRMFPRFYYTSYKLHISLLCRLSSDLYTIDDSLPFILNILLANFVGLLGIAVVLSYVQVSSRESLTLVLIK